MLDGAVESGADGGGRGDVEGEGEDARCWCGFGGGRGRRGGGPEAGEIREGRRVAGRGDEAVGRVGGDVEGEGFAEAGGGAGDCWEE
jgi:hypothetical protein